MTIPGNDLLTQIEHGDTSKLGIYLRRYVLPSIQKTADNSAVSPTADIAPPAPPESINVTVSGEYAQVVVNHAAPIQKGVQYITHFATNPEFTNAIIKDHGCSRSPEHVWLPTNDKNGNPHSWYAATVTQYPGSQPSVTYHGGETAQPFGMGGSSHVDVTPGTGSGTARNGGDALVGIGKSQIRLPQKRQLPQNVTAAAPGKTIATTIAPGVVQPDNSTITINPTTGVISAIGGGSAAFVDDETVAGSGTSWTLANAPVPAASLQLYQYVAGFGAILLIDGTDFTIAGAAITTTNNLSAGVLTAWYRIAAVISYNFADDETVAGTGTAWTLANTPSPSGSLILVQIVAGFGGLTLIVGTDYTIAGAAVTTTNSISTGALRAWYRY